LGRIGTPGFFLTKTIGLVSIITVPPRLVSILILWSSLGVADDIARSSDINKRRHFFTVTFASIISHGRCWGGERCWLFVQ
jgi:hypothetical protein